jgi:hypothetical protein
MKLVNKIIINQIALAIFFFLSFAYYLFKFTSLGEIYNLSTQFDITVQDGKTIIENDLYNFKTVLNTECEYKRDLGAIFSFTTIRSTLMCKKTEIGFAQRYKDKNINSFIEELKEADIEPVRINNNLYLYNHSTKPIYRGIIHSDSVDQYLSFSVIINKVLYDEFVGNIVFEEIIQK